jgi:signal transduction histidine kinase
MSQLTEQPQIERASTPVERVEELGRIIMAYSEVTEKLQESHEKLEQTVRTLREELSEKNRQLEQKKRLAALGEMAAGMAHEIRNPLGGIRLYASMLEGDLRDRPDSAAVVKKITGGVRRLEGVVSQVLQFTREMRANAEKINLAETVSEAVELVGAQRGEATIHVDGPALLEVMADPMLVGQAVLNLVINAVEATEKKGRVTVSYEAIGSDGSEVGREVRQFWLVVEDDGPGMAEGVMDRIFNPFFTTKATGTGLGLAIVHRVVEAHDGTIVAKNGDGGGAKFEIRI